MQESDSTHVACTGATQLLQHIHFPIQGLSGKSRAIVNITRTVCVTLL